MQNQTAMTEYAPALQAERLRLHRAALASSLYAAVALGLLVVILLWDSGWRPQLVGWLFLLAVAVAVRIAVGLGQDAGRTVRGGWLAWHRVAIALHGVAWSALGVLLLPVAERADFVLLTYALSAMAAGALIVTAFDLVGAALFSVPTLAPVVACLHRRADADAAGIVLYAAMLAAITLLGAMRARQSMRDNVRLRLAEAERTEQARRHAEAADRARTELADQHHLMRLLMQTTQEGFWFIDNDGVTVDVNPALCRLLGRRAEDVIGRQVATFFEGEDLELLRRELKARRSGHPGSYEMTIRRPDGSRAHCHNAATPLYDRQGRRIGSVGIWTDLTRRHEAEQALHRYALLANSIDDLVSVISEDGVYRLVNDAWCRQLGVPRERVIGYRIGEFLPAAASEERRRAMAECIATQQPRTVRARGTQGELRGRFIESTFYPYADLAPGLRCVVVVTRDITEQEEARLALAESAEYLARTLNATGDAIFASDAASPSVPVRFVNEQMLQMWGIPAALAPGLTPAQIMAHASQLFADPEAEAAHVQRVVAGNRHDETRVRLKDGRVLLRRCVPALVNGHHVRVWSFRDITAEERALQLAQAGEAEQRALLDAFPGYIFALDEERRYTYVNDRLAALMERPPAQFIGRALRDVAGEEAWLECERGFRRAQGGERAVAERHWPANASHAALDLELTYVVGPLRNGRRQFYVFGQDISARKQAERSLIGARDEAERANRAKSQFLSQMSHELRTPMNAILGLGQLLASDPRHPLPAVQQRWIEEMLRGARHLLDLINEVLDLGRIEAGQLRLEPADVDLAALVGDCLALVRPLADQNDVQLPAGPALPAGCHVRADPVRLRQVLLNLLGNAIKYNRRGGQVLLECRADGERWRLGVRDTGPGIAADQLPRLFKPFERLGAERTGTEGTGIGLALSRRFVEAMDGSVGVDSEPGVGSLFWVSLPRARSAPPAVRLVAPVQHPQAPAANAAAPLVLYVEDNPVNVFVMEAMFERLPDFRLVCATHPAEGLVLARQLAPAVVLLDMQLPDMDGVQVIARLRERRETRAIPVVAVSANGMAADIDAARSAGAADYLVKPIDLEVLAALLHRMTAAPAEATAGSRPGTGT